MRQMIFVCVFHDPKYVRLLVMFLESLFMNGRIQTATTDVVIYTSSTFRTWLEQNSRWYDRLLFVVEDGKTSARSACRARLDVFDLPITRGYDAILYMDTDILVLNDVNPIFAMLKDDLLYAIEEGPIEHNFWGGVLFGDELRRYPKDQKGFNSGVLLFRNSPTMQRLFRDIRQDMMERPFELGLHDQPYFNYHAIRNRLAETQQMKDFVELRLVLVRNRQMYQPSTKTLLHFIDGKHPRNSKEYAMRRYFQSIRL